MNKEALRNIQKKIASKTNDLLQMANETSSIIKGYKPDNLYAFQLQASVMKKQLSAFCTDMENCRKCLLEQNDPSFSISIQLASQNILLATQQIELLTQMLKKSKEAIQLSQYISDMENKTSIEQLKTLLKKGGFL